VATATRRDVERVRARDSDFVAAQALLLARVRAVGAAQRAVLADEAGARYALRQALVDLAAACESAADDLPRPAN
jgi:hypothetical protein